MMSHRQNKAHSSDPCREGKAGYSGPIGDPLDILGTKTLQLPSIRFEVPRNKDYKIPIKGSWKV